MEDWYDPSAERDQLRSRPGPDPFKSGTPSPFRRLPGAIPERILVDTTHSFHIHGVGVDFAASFIVIGAKAGFWGRGGFNAKLRRAYADFMKHCADHGKTTHCGMWSKEKFDMQNVTSFPLSVDGKGFDTVLVCEWLEDHFKDEAMCV